MFIFFRTQIWVHVSCRGCSWVEFLIGSSQLITGNVSSMQLLNRQYIYSYASDQQGCTPEQLDYPQGVAFVVRSQNNLYIADCHKDRVVLVSNEGALKGCIDLHWDGLDKPTAITIDQEWYIIVTCLKARYQSQCTNLRHLLWTSGI